MHRERENIRSASLGIVYTWNRPECQVFSAGFQPVDQYIVYRERENEFDVSISDLSVVHSEASAAIEEEPWIDIVSVRPCQTV